MLFRSVKMLTVAVLMAPTLASSQEVRDYDVSFRIRCEAVLLSGSRTMRLMSSTPDAVRLAKSSCGKSTVLEAGKTVMVGGQLECSKKNDSEPLTFRFLVKLNANGKEVHHASVRNLGLDQGAGKQPVTLDSYAFLEPEVVVDGVKFTRIDYSCSIETLPKR